MSTSTIPAFLNELVDTLATLEGLQQVTISSGLAGPTVALEQVAIGAQVEVDDQPLTMGGNRLETYTVSGELIIEKPGAGEDAIRNARDRAFEVYAVIETYLNDYPTVGGTVTHAQLQRNQVRNNIAMEGRTCEIDFDIHVRAAKNP
jgi:cell division ATPase FtsA